MLRRYTGPESAPLSTWVDSPIQAKLTPASAEEIVAGISSASFWIIASPTDVGTDPVGIAKDVVILAGAEKKVMRWSVIAVGTEPVRIEGRLG